MKGQKAFHPIPGGSAVRRPRRDDNVAWAERRQQHLLDPGDEACAVDRLVEQGASIRSQRSAARKVIVRQWP
jgi:hypothetical protein